MFKKLWGFISVTLNKILDLGVKPGFDIQTRRLYRQVNGLNLFYTFVALSVGIISFTVLEHARGTFYLGIVQIAATILYFSNLILTRYDKINLVRKMTITIFEWHLFLVAILTNAWASPVLLVIVLYPLLAALVEESIMLHFGVGLLQMGLCIGFNYLFPVPMADLLHFNNINAAANEILKIMGFFYFPFMAAVIIQIIFRENLRARDRQKELMKKQGELLETISAANNEMMMQMAMARKIQETIIPRSFPETGVVRFNGKYLPMDDIGGDFYDVYRIGDRKLGIVIGDVSGHGVPAALITMMLKVAFKNHSHENLGSHEIMNSVNSSLFSILEQSEKFVTLFFGVIDIHVLEMDYTSAGHNDVIILGSNGSIRTLQSQNSVMGLSQEMDFQSTRVRLNHREKIILYTDGIPEARDHEHHLFSFEKLVRLIQDNHMSDPDELSGKIISEVTSFSGIHLSDDLALVVADIISDRQHPEAVIHQAFENYRNGNYVSSIKALLDLDKAGMTAPDLCKASYLLGCNYLKTRNYPDAARCLEESLTHGPGIKKIEDLLQIVKSKLNADTSSQAAAS